MNDLSKKTEEEVSRAIPSGNDEHASEEHYGKKLDAYLLLIYQAYLKKETQLEPKIKTTLLARVKRDKDFAFKVRMMQLDYLNLKTRNGTRQTKFFSRLSKLFRNLLMNIEKR